METKEVYINTQVDNVINNIKTRLGNDVDLTTLRLELYTQPPDADHPHFYVVNVLTYHDNKRYGIGVACQFEDMVNEFSEKLKKKFSKRSLL